MASPGVERGKERLRAWLAAGAAPTFPVPAGTPQTVPLPVCPLEGNVLELCHTCRGYQEGRHVRECGHEDNPTGKCTRSFVSDKVWACDRCSRRPQVS